MFSSNLKRSVATLCVVAGLLVAAGPASAQGGGADFTRFVVDGPISAKVEHRNVLDTGMFEHEWLKGVQYAPGSDSIWDIEHDGYADAHAGHLTRPFWPAAFEPVLA